MSTQYEINKGANRALEFKGIKAQYIIYLAVGLILILLLFAVLYMCGLKVYYCLAVVVPLGAAFIVAIQRMSRAFGEHGLLKKMAARRLPTSIRSRSREVFVGLHTPPTIPK